MVNIKNLRKSYTVGNQKLEVLKGLNLTISEGEMVSIMGSSGSGKSTLLNILGILDDYDEGEYTLNNVLIKNLNQTRAAHLRNRFLGFVFQSFNLINYKSAIENVELPLYYQKVSRKKRHLLAMQYLEMLGMQDRAKHLPSELSGGQQQRIAIARALVTQPKVILADEPTGALDSKTSEDVMQIFKEVNKTGITMIIVTHENEVAEQTNRVIHLKDGEILKPNHV